jgi:hypothetical protein
MARTALDTTASAVRPYVSKSKFLWGSQCKKLLWVAYNAKDQIPEPDAATQAIFDQGHEVGALAKSLYPGGIEVSADVTDFEQVHPELDGCGQGEEAAVFMAVLVNDSP